MPVAWLLFRSAARLAAGLSHRLPSSDGQVATAFAARFYRGLAGGDGIRAAFKAAAGIEAKRLELRLLCTAHQMARRS
jgi:hypothetical protein